MEQDNQFILCGKTKVFVLKDECLNTLDSVVRHVLSNNEFKTIHTIIDLKNGHIKKIRNFDIDFTAQDKINIFNTILGVFLNEKFVNKDILLDKEYFIQKSIELTEDFVKKCFDLEN